MRGANIHLSSPLAVQAGKYSNWAFPRCFVHLQTTAGQSDLPSIHLERSFIVHALHTNTRSTLDFSAPSSSCCVSTFYFRPNVSALYSSSVFQRSGEHLKQSPDSSQQFVNNPEYYILPRLCLSHASKTLTSHSLYLWEKQRREKKWVYSKKGFGCPNCVNTLKQMIFQRS